MACIQLTFRISLEIKPIFGNFFQISHHIDLQLIKVHILGKLFHFLIWLKNSPTRPPIWM
jgi:hypothetical protein